MNSYNRNSNNWNGNYGKGVKYNNQPAKRQERRLTQVTRTDHNMNDTTTTTRKTLTAAKRVRPRRDFIG